MNGVERPGGWPRGGVLLDRDIHKPVRLARAGPRAAPRGRSVWLLGRAPVRVRNRPATGAGVLDHRRTDRSVRRTGLGQRCGSSVPYGIASDPPRATSTSRNSATACRSSAPTGSFIGAFGSTGTGSGQFSGPTGGRRRLLRDHLRRRHPQQPRAGMESGRTSDLRHDASPISKAVKFPSNRARWRSTRAGTSGLGTRLTTMFLSSTRGANS